MRFPLHKLRSYSDSRLMNVVVLREQYGYPFDYVEACKEELRRRGYSSAELQQAIDGAADGDLPKRLRLNGSIALTGRLLIWLPAISALLFVVLFAVGVMWSESARKAVGGIAVLFLCFSFLVYTYRTILRGRLAELDSNSSDHLSP